VNPEDYEPDLDDLTRADLAELAHLPWSKLSDVLDEWLHRAHGVTSSRHHVGLFCDLLGENGLEVRFADPVPDIAALLGKAVD
jgi:hypothetical protein